MAASIALQAASLILPALHFRASLRSTPCVPFRLHSLQQLTVHRLPIFARLLFATGFGAVMPFAEKSKSLASPLLQAVASLHTHPSVFLVWHRWLISQTARAYKNKTFAKHCIRFVFVNSHQAYYTLISSFTAVDSFLEIQNHS
jgi:hypothetical protein